MTHCVFPSDASQQGLQGLVDGAELLDFGVHLALTFAFALATLLPASLRLPGQ